MRGLHLLRRRSFSLLWFAGLISLTGDWLLGIALPIYVYKLTGSPAATSAVVAVSVTAALLAGAVAGVYVDRWDRRRVLVVANLLQVGAILPLLAVDSANRVWIVLIVAFAESALGQFVAPAEQSLLPSLVGPADLTAANSLNGLNRNIARLGGPALGAIVATTLGLSGAALLDAASFALAAGLVALIGGAHRAVPSSEPALPRADRVSPLARWRFELAEGLRAIQGSRVVRALMVVLAVSSVGEGIMGSLFAVFAARGIDGGATAIGWLMSAQAVGGILGGLLAVTFAARLRPLPTVTVAYLLFGLIDLIIFNLPRFTGGLLPQLVLFVLVGVPGAFGLAAAMTLLQSEVADALRGRVFAAFGVVQSAAALIGAGLAAFLTEQLSVFTVLTIQGSGYVIAAFVFGRMAKPRRRLDRTVVRLPIGGNAELLSTSASASQEACQRRWGV